MCFLKILGFICIPLLNTLCLSDCEQTEEFFLRLKGSFSWEPKIASYPVKHRSLCLSRCLSTNHCVAIYAKYRDGEQYKWSCTLLGELFIGSVQRLESGETWINRTESSQCPHEFRFSVGKNCYYLETAAGLSWEQFQVKMSNSALVL